MFYPELKQTILYEANSDLMNRFDLWLGMLPRNSKIKITSSLIAGRFGISSRIADLILESCCTYRILEKKYGILCPDCVHLISITTKEELYDELSSAVYCYACGYEGLTSAEDIINVYVLIKAPTGDIESIVDEIGIKIESDFAAEKRLNERIEDGTENPNDIMYAPSIDERKKLQEYYQVAKNGTFDNTLSKGKALEDFANYLFNLVKCFNSTTDIKVKMTLNQLDCTVRNKVSTIQPSVLNDLGSLFVIECKSEKHKPNNTYFHKVCSIIDSMVGVKVGIVVSFLEPTQNCIEIAREKLLRHEIYLLSFTEKDLEEITYDGYNLLDKLQLKIHELMLYSSRSLTDTELYDDIANK